MLIIDLKRILVSRYFTTAILGIVLVVLINLFDELYLHKGFLSSGSVFYYYIFRNGLGGISILSYIFIVFPNALSYAEERVLGMIKFIVVRSGMHKYCRVKVFSTIIVTITAVSISYIVVIGVLRVFMPFFPQVDSISNTYGNVSYFLQLAEEKNLLFYIFHIFHEATSATFLAIITLFFSIWIKNKYILICIPILSIKIWEHLSGLLQFPRLLNWTRFVNNNLIDVMDDEVVNYFFTIGYFLIGIAVFGIMFCYFVKRDFENV